MEKLITKNWKIKLISSDDSVLDKFFSIGPYSLNDSKKSQMLISGIKSLIEHHFWNNLSYKNILNSIGYDKNLIQVLGDLPFLPTRIFKEIELVTNPKNSAIRSVTSSGTSGQNTSKVFIDTETAGFQTKALVKIVSYYIGNRRIPMLVIDKPSTIKDRNVFSARAAGVLGFSNFASEITFGLEEDMTPNWKVIQEFADNHAEDPVLVFGFTSIVWLHLLKEMEAQDIDIKLRHGTFFHGGGWKKIAEEDQVTKTHFKSVIKNRLGISNLHDYYGMAEQTGSIMIECEFGFMHTSIYSEILIRDQLSHKICSLNELGLIETISILPKSYPGHVLLTEDLGRKIGIDTCLCGKMGSYFVIEGRVKRAEIRGCSDTYRAD